MGFLEVVMNLRTIFKNIAFCKDDIIAFQPDVIIFIDYPGFNMRIAKWAKANHFKTHYYISPQIWAWKENRIHHIKRDIDKMYVILPFEKEFYEEKHQMPVTFVGHPLIDAIANRPKADAKTLRKTYGLSEKPIVALLPGSRQQEIKKMLHVMLSVVDAFPEYQFVIAGAPSQAKAFYQKFIKNKNIKFVSNATYDLLSIAQAALVTSGTATLETALFKVPQVVCYKSSWLSYQIGKQVVKLNYISLVNLIMEREVVCELIQNDLNTKRLTAELKHILDPKTQQQLNTEYTALEQKLGGTGASQKVAKAVFKALC
jgi:lipid-A-disaccharide synthase